jgi:hypothetical protein
MLSININKYKYIYISREREENSVDTTDSGEVLRCLYPAQASSVAELQHFAAACVKDSKLHESCMGGVEVLTIYIYKYYRVSNCIDLERF